MLAVSSDAAAVAAVARARTVALGAYILRPADSGALIGALCAAADRGAAVTVRLEAHPYHDDGSLRAANDQTIAQLRVHGADAGYFASDRPLHIKALVADETLFLDDRNWPADGRDVVLRTDDADDVKAAASALAGTPGSDGHFETVKSSALRLEERLIYRSPSDSIDCQSESFGFSGVYGALKARAEAGAHVRLIVAARDLNGNASEKTALAKLARSGVAVRVGDDDNKLTLAGDTAWAGSANATDGKPLTVDWGMRTRVPAVVAALRARFAQNWADARPLEPRAAPIQSPKS